MLLADDIGKGGLLEDFENLRIPEESGDVDQDIVEQRLHFVRFLPQDLGIVLKSIDFAQEHPPPHAALYGSSLIETEVHASGFLQNRKYPFQGLIAASLRLL